MNPVTRWTNGAGVWYVALPGGPTERRRARYAIRRAIRVCELASDSDLPRGYRVTVERCPEFSGFKTPGLLWPCGTDYPGRVVYRER